MSWSTMALVRVAVPATTSLPGTAATTIMTTATTRKGGGGAAVRVTWLHNFFSLTTYSITVDKTRTSLYRDDS